MMADFVDNPASLGERAETLFKERCCYSKVSVYLCLKPVHFTAE